ncbi:hypothetical protein PHMEG_00012768 [Phytophthora megakarya]|uniref:Uncharacterized protein n=1 Tax=Phytophthora megakarya TaxID=4795 RepID=A0A225W8E9_9STRA|nr:hypothetical protein PHMEG_00012768 [Phytophthora megakarya]
MNQFVAQAKVAEKLIANTTNEQFDHFKGDISEIPELNSVAILSQKAVFGGNSKAEVKRIRNMVTGVADRAGVQFNERESQLCVVALHIDEFKFTSARAFRITSQL